MLAPLFPNRRVLSQSRSDSCPPGPGRAVGGVSFGPQPAPAEAWGWKGLQNCTGDGGWIGFITYCPSLGSPKIPLLRSGGRIRAGGGASAGRGFQLPVLVFSFSLLLLHPSIRPPSKSIRSFVCLLLQFSGAPNVCVLEWEGHRACAREMRGHREPLPRLVSFCSCGRFSGLTQAQSPARVTAP